MFACIERLSTHVLAIFEERRPWSSGSIFSGYLATRLATSRLARRVSRATCAFFAQRALGMPLAMDAAHPAIFPGNRKKTAMNASKMKIVYVISERNSKSYWNRIGVAFVNNDGSINVKLDAVPVSGELQIRDYVAKEDGTIPFGRRSNGEADVLAETG